MFKTRKYKTGTNWCFWRWTDVDSKYITRLHLIKTPLFAICLHWINSPDLEPYLHDHPVSFLSIILRGWYKEERYSYSEKYNTESRYIRCNKWFNFIKASEKDRHRIIEVAPKTLTLCFMGPKNKQWGFYIEKNWIYWKDYYKLKKNNYV